MITAATRLAGVIGDPVRHSLSPRLHNAAYRALGLDWVYLAFEVADGGAGAALDAVRNLGLIGLSVTMPHKTAVAERCDELTPAAARLRSVNTVTPIGDGRLVGDSTDGEGFLRSLADAGVDPSARDALVLGAGGAARAVACALTGCGARVAITARRAPAAEAAAALSGASPVAWADRGDAASAVGVIVNATPIGMAGDSSLPVPAGVVGRAHVVADLVYEPRETPLLAAARAGGATVVPGLGMLVHQAALQVERWSGQPAPVDVMRAAVELA